MHKSKIGKTVTRSSRLEARTAGIDSKSAVIPEWCYRVSRGVVVYLVVAVAFHCTLFTVHCFSAGAPAFIAKQGQVRVAGQPANGEKSIVFRVYDAPSNGTKVWERNCTVYCINGMFNYPLSTDNSGTATNGKSIADLDFTTTQYYMAMSLDGGVNELMPREPIAAIPYAFAASTATCLRGNGHIRITGAGDHYIQNGNVGIGILNPAAKLDVQGAGGVNVQYGVNASTMVLIGTGNGIYGLKVSSGVLLATSGGNVGIGTTNPDFKFHVKNETSVTNSEVATIVNEAYSTGDMADGFGPALNFKVGDSAASNHIALIKGVRDGTDTSGRLHLGVKNSGTWNQDAVVIRANGSVGIGTTSPISQLSIYKVDGGGDIGISVGNDFSATAKFGAITYSDGSDIFSIQGGAWSGTTRPLILQGGGGNVGIGTVSPGSYKLNVSGNMYTSSIQIGASAGSIGENWWEFGKNDGTTGTAIDMHGGTTYSDYTARFFRWGGDNGILQISNHGTGGVSFGNEDSAPVKLITSNTPRMTIDGNGNVGIGKTNPQYPLDVAGSVTQNIINYGYLMHYSEGWFHGFNASLNGAPISIYASNRIVCDEFNAVSDMRLKNFFDNINPQIALKAVNSLKPVQYTWKPEFGKGDISVKAGFFAQDVSKSIPEAVSVYSGKLPDEHHIDYNMMITYTVGAIQALSAKLNILKTENEELKAEIKEIKKMLEMK